MSRENQGRVLDRVGYRTIGEALSALWHGVVVWEIRVEVQIEAVRYGVT